MKCVVNNTKPHYRQVHEHTDTGIQAQSQRYTTYTERKHRQIDRHVGSHTHMCMHTRKQAFYTENWLITVEYVHH